MKQKLYYLLALTFLLLFGTGKNVVHAATETPGNTGTSNTPVIGASYTLAGIYVAGSGGVKQGTMATKGIKLRTNQEGNVIVISVNSGYEINSASMYFATNGSSTLELTGVSVDGVDQKKSATIPAKNGSTSADIELTGLHATENITLYFPSNSNTQIVGDFHFTYTQKAVVVQEISSVTLNGSAISAENLATLKSTKAVTIDGSSLNGCGALGVTLSSGSTTVTRSISGSTATYTFTINTSDNYTVTVNNIPNNYSKIGKVVAYSGDAVTGQNESTITMNDISFSMVSTDKTFQYGSGSVSLGGTTYVPLKLSTGSAVNVTFPENKVATKVIVYGWSANGDGKLYSMGETSELIKSVTVNNDIFYATNTENDLYPSVYEYNLDYWESLYFNAGGSPSQPFVVMDFVLEDKPTNISAKISSAGWATLYTPLPLNFSGVEGLTAYTATVTNNTVTLTKVQNNVPANTGVVLEGAADTYYIPVVASSETAKGDLQGSATDATAFDAYSGYTLYILTQNGNDVQFNPCTSGSIKAGKAFLKVATDNNNSGGAKALSVVFANDPTGISTVNATETAQPVKRIVNGKLVIEKNGKHYNAAGAEF